LDAVRGAFDHLAVMDRRELGRELIASSRGAGGTVSLLYWIGTELSVPASRSQTRKQMAAAAGRGEMASLASDLPRHGPWATVQRALMALVADTG
jgi:hypothetical protein